MYKTLHKTRKEEALFSDFGPILFDDCYEDLTLGYRALLKDAYHFIPKALLRYRIGGLSSWQKNPLEKKRGRLKSTLTQRAVDSMRSGDFEALATIQDCYSQYGFSIKPHPERVSITLLSDRSEARGLMHYSISDHFNTLHNMYKVYEKETGDFSESLSPDYPLNDKDLLWIAAQRINTNTLLKLIAHPYTNRFRNVVLDIGVYSGVDATTPQDRNLNTAISLFLDRFPSGVIHTSCANTATALTSRRGRDRISFLHPVQYIDGPDPAPDPHEDKRGLVIELGTHNSSGALMSALRNIAARGGHLRVTFTMIRADENVGGVRSTSTTNEWVKLQSPDDIKQFDFVVIHGAERDQHDGCMLYWWSLASKWAIPTFLAAGPIQSEHLMHGKTCLFVDQNPMAWTTAIDLVTRRADGLRMVAIEARRVAYFNYSIQKMIMYAANVVEASFRDRVFFNRFLAL
jgi:hypothetical protein